MAQADRPQTDKPQTFVENFRGKVLSSIPAVSALTFVLVAVKVYRAAGMEASTTVAIVSGADIVALLEGVILTLLPSFLALLVSAAIWWWARGLRFSEAKETPGQALLSIDHVTAWILVAVGFLTLPWPFFVVLFVPFMMIDVWLFLCLRGKQPGLGWARRSRRALLTSCVVVGGFNVAFLALSPTVWLPLRSITILPGHSVELKGASLSNPLGAYVLSQDDKRVVLLLDSPRAVIEVDPSIVEPRPPICIPEPATLRHLLYLRPVQVLHLEGDPGSPYPICPQST